MMFLLKTVTGQREPGAVDKESKDTDDSSEEDEQIAMKKKRKVNLNKG